MEGARTPEDRERRMMKEGRETVETRMRDHTEGDLERKATERPLIVLRRTTSRVQKTIATRTRQ